MGRTILSERVRFLDSGAYYLSPTQIESPFLEVRINIQAIQSPLSVSFMRNPPQSVYGYLTTCYQECTYDEVQVRYDYQSCYRHFDSYQLLAQLHCIYYGAISQNQRNIADSNGAQGPYTTVSVDGLTRFMKRPVDSFRFKGINPCVFDFEVFWLFDDTDYGVCGAVGEDLPIPGNPMNSVPAYDPDINSDPNAVSEEVTSELPDDDQKTEVPVDAPSTDFSPRNVEPEPPPTQGIWTFQIVFQNPGSEDVVSSNRTGDSDYAPRMVAESGYWYERWRLNGVIQQQGWYPTSVVQNAFTRNLSFS